MGKIGRAAVDEAPNQPFVLNEYPVRNVRSGEILVRVSMSTICRSDIHSYQGKRPNPCPGILGHEIIGTIEEIGPGIEKDMRGDLLKVGDRITWSEYFHDGPCYYRKILDMPQKCHGVRKYGHDHVDADQSGASRCALNALKGQDDCRATRGRGAGFGRMGRSPRFGLRQFSYPNQALVGRVGRTVLWLGRVGKGRCCCSHQRRAAAATQFGSESLCT